MRTLDYVRKGMLVRRYHQFTTLETDTVGKHSAGVALIVMMLDPDCRKELLAHCLTHDLCEFTMGDMPATAKRLLDAETRAAIKHAEHEAEREAGIPTFKLFDSEQMLFKLADYFDGLLFCIEERERGNQSMQSVGDTFISYIPQYFNEAPPGVRWYDRALEMFTTLRIKWENLNGK